MAMPEYMVRFRTMFYARSEDFQAKLQRKKLEQGNVYSSLHSRIGINSICNLLQKKIHSTHYKAIRDEGAKAGDILPQTKNLAKRYAVLDGNELVDIQDICIKDKKLRSELNFNGDFVKLKSLPTNRLCLAVEDLHSYFVATIDLYKNYEEWKSDTVKTWCISGNVLDLLKIEQSDMAPPPNQAQVQVAEVQGENVPDPSPPPPVRTPFPSRAIQPRITRSQSSSEGEPDLVMVVLDTMQEDDRQAAAYMNQEHAMNETYLATEAAHEARLAKERRAEEIAHETRLAKERRAEREAEAEKRRAWLSAHKDKKMAIFDKLLENIQERGIQTTATKKIKSNMTSPSSIAPRTLFSNHQALFPTPDAGDTATEGSVHLHAPLGSTAVSFAASPFAAGTTRRAPSIASAPRDTSETTGRGAPSSASFAPSGLRHGAASDILAASTASSTPYLYNDPRSRYASNSITVPDSGEGQKKPPAFTRQAVFAPTEDSVQEHDVGSESENSSAYKHDSIGGVHSPKQDQFGYSLQSSGDEAHSNDEGEESDSERAGVSEGADDTVDSSNSSNNEKDGGYTETPSKWNFIPRIPSVFRLFSPSGRKTGSASAIADGKTPSPSNATSSQTSASPSSAAATRSPSSAASSNMPMPPETTDAAVVEEEKEEIQEITDYQQDFYDTYYGPQPIFQEGWTQDSDTACKSKNDNSGEDEDDPSLDTESIKDAKALDQGTTTVPHQAAFSGPNAIFRESSDATDGGLGLENEPVEQATISDFQVEDIDHNVTSTSGDKALDNLINVFDFDDTGEVELEANEPEQNSNWGGEAPDRAQVLAEAEDGGVQAQAEQVVPNRAQSPAMEHHLVENERRSPDPPAPKYDEADAEAEPESKDTKKGSPLKRLGKKTIKAAKKIVKKLSPVKKPSSPDNGETFLVEIPITSRGYPCTRCKYVNGKVKLCHHHK